MKEDLKLVWCALWAPAVLATAWIAGSLAAAAYLDRTKGKLLARKIETEFWEMV